MDVVHDHTKRTNVLQSVICHSCGKTGHFAKYCRTRTSTNRVFTQLMKQGTLLSLSCIISGGHNALPSKTSTWNTVTDNHVVGAVRKAYRICGIGPHIGADITVTGVQHLDHLGLLDADLDSPPGLGIILILWVSIHSLLPRPLLSWKHTQQL